MSRLQKPKYLAKRGEIYYFRLAIPTALRPRFGCQEMKLSLRTNDWRLGRARCRYLSNKFEDFFIAVASMPELTQDQLLDIARKYFRELLVESNDQIFWIEVLGGIDTPAGFTGACVTALKRSQHPLALWTPLIWSAINRQKGKTSIVNNPIPASPMVEGLPGYGADVFTRTGFPHYRY